MQETRPKVTQQALRVASCIPKSNQVRHVTRDSLFATDVRPAGCVHYPFQLCVQVLWKRASTLEAEALLQESRDLCDRAALMQTEAMKILDDIRTAKVDKYSCVIYHFGYLKLFAMFLFICSTPLLGCWQQQHGAPSLQARLQRDREVLQRDLICKTYFSVDRCLLARMLKATPANDDGVQAGACRQQLERACDRPHAGRTQRAFR